MAMGPAVFVLALWLSPPSGPMQELSDELDKDLQMPINQAARPWMSLSFGMGAALGPIDLSARPRVAIGLLWDALEIGGTLIGGANLVALYGGGGVFVNWTPVPYRAGHIVYTHAGAGRLHFKTAVGPQHFDYLRFALGFRIARRPPDVPFLPWLEFGYTHLRACADWAIPCGWAGRAAWAPWLEFGFRFK